MSLRLFLLWFTVAISVTAQAETAFRQLRINENTQRPLNVAVWYPTDQHGMTETVGENPAFRGTSVLRDAKPAPGAHPLLLISHGYGGNWRNLNWLAQRMAEQGYIVAAPDHPGTTTRNKTPQDAQQLWLRPQDLRAVLNTLLENADWAGRVDSRRIAALGHSLGGWTVMELAGGRFDSRRFVTDCQQHAALSSCKLTSTLGIDRPLAGDKLAADMRDPRIKAVVSLDLGLARGFTPESLRQIAIPVLIMAAQADSDALPDRLESGYLADNIPAARQRYSKVDGATHFSFMQLCKPGAVELIEAQDPGEGIVCEDGPAAKREAIHQRLLYQITAFLRQALAD
ncbi:alpha/beta fold hydrolase [Enterobacter sp. Bisph1]|uniref:alpha/beta hydrolase family protein n=1 Tax=Enterobacter sp. Bisph1 TaxID=1274399 RepID=UPI00057BE452|nr:alpha/beta fold hydrolase [Enterobacter sp. Bisph1]